MIRLLDNGDKAEVLEYLGRNEIETSFLYANVINIGLENDKEIRRCADYFGFFCGERLKGILPFYNLGSCIPHYETEDAVACFADIMKKRKFEYLMGMDRIVRPIYEGIREHKNILKCNESIYFINKDFIPFTVGGLELIDAKEATGERKFVDFLIRVRNIGFGENVTGEEAVRSLGTDPEEDAVIAAVNGEPVAFAKIQTYTDTLSQIGSVYTEEAHRGKGYCKAVVSEICRRIEGKGKMPALFARKNNTPAVRAYLALGFRHFDDYLFIELGE